MALSGDLESISLVSLLQIIEVERKTGILRIDSGSFQRILYLRDGAIIFLVSNEPRDFFGHFLVQNGIISEEILAKALKRQFKTKELLGQVVQSLTKISEEKINQQLRKKIEESFYQLFLLDKAEFTLIEEDISKEKFPETFQLDTRNLLMEGMRRLDEFRKFKKIFPGMNQVFTVHRENIGPELSEMGIVPKILDCLEQGACVEDLCLHFHSYEYTILRYLNILLERNIIGMEKVGTEQIKEPSEAGGSFLRKAKEAEKGGHWLEAAEIYKNLLKIDPKNQNIRDQFNKAQDEYVLKITKEELPMQSILVLNKGINFQKEKLSTLDGFIISRINDQWTVAEIVSVVPCSEMEVIKCLKSLLDRKIIVKK